MSHKVAEDDGRWPMVGSFSLATFAAPSIPFFLLFFFSSSRQFHPCESYQTRFSTFRPSNFHPSPLLPSKKTNLSDSKDYFVHLSHPRSLGGRGRERGAHGNVIDPLEEAKDRYERLLRWQRWLTGIPVVSFAFTRELERRKG